MEEEVKALGFDSLVEYHKLVSGIDLTSADKLKYFNEWNRSDGTKAGILKLTKPTEQMKNTNGKWRIQEQFDKPLLIQGDNGVEWYNLDVWIFAGDRIIGTVNYKTDTDGGYNTVNNLEEAKANAKLIVQSPNLLKECIKAFELVSKLQVPTEQELHDLSNSLKGVIEKATK